jgi:hypothetical protein
MHRFSSFALALMLASIALTTRTATASAPGLWLDNRAPRAWNQPGAPIASAPAWSTDGKTIAGRRDPELLPGGRCAAQVHRPSTPTERAVAAKGWFLFSPGASSMIATSGPRWSVVLGMADADGMCRPLAYQVFAFVGGRFVGTLSPTLMASRTDGAFITTLHRCRRVVLSACGDARSVRHSHTARTTGARADIRRHDADVVTADACERSSYGSESGRKRRRCGRAASSPKRSFFFSSYS